MFNIFFVLLSDRKRRHDFLLRRQNIPLFFVVFLEDVELGLLCYSSYEMKVIDFIENLIFNNKLIFSSLTIITKIAFFGLPLLIILIIFHHFKRVDIRVD